MIPFFPPAPPRRRPIDPLPRPPLHIPNMPRRNILADNLPTKIHKGLIDIPARSSTCFVVRGAVPGGGDGEGARARDGPVFFEIALVADDDERHERVVFDPHDLVAEFLQFDQGGERGYAEDEEEALA